MDVTEEVTATLRAEAHHPPCVMEAAGFCTEHSANARSIGYEEERSPTLRAGVVPAAIALENHPADSRVKISEDGKVQTLTSRCGTGGGNVPMVMDAVENSVESPVKEVENSPAVTLKIRSGCEGGGKGAIWQEEKSATLGCNNDQTLFVPKCYGVCSMMRKSAHQETAQPVPCQMINCFCMYSDYTPLTLEEWVECDQRRRGTADQSNTVQCALDMISDDFMSDDCNQ